jgi:hypothetical protein
LIVVMDRSDSMNWWSSECTAVIVAGGVQVPQATNCWQLWILFVERLVTTLFQQNPALYWAGVTTGDETSSFRVGMYGFWCSNDQTVPQGLEILALTGDYDAYQVGVRTALAMIPDGGTCPGMILEDVLAQVQASNPRAFPFATVITFTDGVFYDGTRPMLASAALRQACVNTFAVGIAITKPGPGDKPGTTGLTPAELVTQQSQILALAGDPERIYVLIQSEPVPNPWAQLFALLDEMSIQILTESSTPLNQLNCSMTVPVCQFEQQSFCTLPFQAHYCKWTSNSNCELISDCTMWNGNEAGCKGDAYCLWTGTNGQCAVRENLLPSNQVPVPESTCDGLSSTQCQALKEECVVTGNGVCVSVSFCGFGDETSCGANPAWCWWDVWDAECRSFFGVS